MAATTIHSLVYKVVADSQQFTKGITATRSELSAAKKLMLETKSPAERLGMSIEALNKLHTKGAIDAATHARALKGLQKEFKDTQAAASKGGVVGDTLGRLSPSLAALATPAGAIAGITAGIAALGTASVKLAADMEQTEVSFRVLLGSASAANVVLADLQEFASSTPFQFPELTDATKKLIAFGVAQEDLIPTLTSIGDISAGLGIPIGELSEIYGKARVQGRLFAEDVNQLTGRGIPVIQEFAKQFGVTESEVRKLVESGSIGFENLEQAFQSLTGEGGKFSGLMEAQSQTLSGLASTVQDEVTVAMTEFGRALTEDLDLKQVTSDVLELIKAFRELIPAISFTVKLSLKPSAVATELLANALVDEAAAVETVVKEMDKAKVDSAPEVGSQDPLKKSFEKELEALERQRDSIGKSKQEIELMEAAQKGYSDEQQKAIAAVLEEIAAKEKLIDTEKALRENLEKQEKGKADAKQKLAENLAKSEEKAKKAEAEELKKTAEKIAASTVSPGEKLGREQFDIQQALDAGLITPEQALAANTSAYDNFKNQFQNGPKAPSTTAGAAVERGSAEAFSALNNAKDRGQANMNKLPKIAQDQLDVAKETLKTLQAGAGGTTVVENQV